MGERRYYENADLWDSQRGWDGPAERARFEETIGLIPQDVRTLVDLGCGNGTFLKHLGKARPEIKRTGLDRSRAALEAAAKVSGCPVTQGNADATPYESESFDCVTAMEILEHLSETSYRNTINELERIAKNHILISTPYNEVLIQIECPECRCRFNPNYHLRRFNETNLRTLFQNFNLADTALVWEEKRPLFYGALHAIYTRVINRFPAFAQCPDCGYRRNEAACSTRPQAASETKAFLKRIMPGNTRHRWIVCRYARKRL